VGGAVASSDIQRKLTAILCADVVGYSRLMGDNEAATLRLLTEYRQVFSDYIDKFRGRIVNAPGDSILAEFASVVDGVGCAAEIQRELAERNAELVEERKMLFRIGINQGDVMVRGEEIYGDAINIAARLESLAEPGGICVSRPVFDQVKKKIKLHFEYMGEQQVKNIAEPVPAYQVLTKPGDAAHRVAQTKQQTPKKAPALPERPSIAVMPFANMSGDPEQEYFTDGITEDIITELSRFRSLLVIARTSSFAYKGRAVNVQTIGKELGAHFVLEGSVRKAANRVRITAQLIDATDGKHLWAERFDRDLEDVFAVQDEIAQIIVAKLPRHLEAADLNRAKRKTTENMAAYDYLLRGKVHHQRRTKDDNAQAVRMFEKAIEHDPEFARAYALKAWALSQAWGRGFLAQSDELWKRIATALQTACSLGDDDSECHRIASEVHLNQREHDRAEVHQERAFALNPNDPRIVSLKGELLTWIGRGQEGAEWIEKAIRLDPYPPDKRAHRLGRAWFVARRYEEAVMAFKRITTPNFEHHAFLAGCYAGLDRKEDAEAHAAEVRKMMPDFSVDKYLEHLPYKNKADIEHHREALRKAGLPD